MSEEKQTYSINLDPSIVSKVDAFAIQLDGSELNEDFDRDRVINEILKEFFAGTYGYATLRNILL